MLHWLFCCCCFSILQTIQYIYTHYSDIFTIRAPDNFLVGGAISPYFLYQTGICCFSDKNSALWSENKHWLSLSPDKMSVLSNMSTCGLLLFFLPCYRCSIYHLLLSNNQCNIFFSFLKGLLLDSKKRAQTQS
jgi:hypothetical protein